MEAHLPHVHLVRELACGGARACEDCGAVAVRVGVDEGDRLVEGGNGERAIGGSIQAGDAFVAATSLGSSNTVTLEGLNYDGVLENLGALDPSKPVRLQLKRLKRMPRATVRLVFPEVEKRPDETLTLFTGANVRRSMLSSGVKLNDPLARRFDAGSGTGDCGGEGTCCTCVVDVQRGAEALSDPGIQETQILKSYPRWRLACKASVAELEEDVEVVMKVQPRNFDGFYGDDEVDLDGKPLAREGRR